VVVDADGELDGMVEVVARGEVVTVGVGLVAEGELDAVDPSPPPSTNTTVSPAIAAAADGPRARGTLHACSPVDVSIASTVSRPTTITSSSVRIGAGVPRTLAGSPIPAMTCHETV
jgi:hypothetical protein